MSDVDVARIISDARKHAQAVVSTGSEPHWGLDETDEQYEERVYGAACIEYVAEHGVRLVTDPDDHELIEARAEIARHHELIVKLRDDLQWALGFIDWLSDSELWNEPARRRYDGARKLLAREVG